MIRPDGPPDLEPDHRRPRRGARGCSVVASTRRRRRDETVVVRGEAGIGKSRLVSELAARPPSRGSELVVGGCPALVDSPLPFAPIVAATEAILRTRDDAALHVLLDGIGPRPRAHRPRLGGPVGVDDPRPFPRRIIPGRCSTRCGRSSSGPPRTAARGRVRGPPLGGPGVARPHRVPRAEPRLARRDRAHVPQRRAPPPPPAAAVDRGALAGADGRGPRARPARADEVAVQAEAILGRPPEPALVDELVQAGRRQRVHHRGLLASLDPAGRMPRSTRRHAGAPRPRRDAAGDAGSSVEAMSVAGVGVDEATVASVIAVPGLDVESALRSALDAQLIVGSGDGYAFRHALLQEAVYDGLLPSERRRYHLAYAPALEAASGHPRWSTTRSLPTTCPWRCGRRSPPGAACAAGAFVDARGISSAPSSSWTRSRTREASWRAGEPRCSGWRPRPRASHGSRPCRPAVGGGDRCRSRGRARGARRAPVRPRVVRQRRIPERARACIDTRGQRLLADSRPRASGASPSGPGSGPVSTTNRTRRPRQPRRPSRWPQRSAIAARGPCTRPIALSRAQLRQDTIQ